MELGKLLTEGKGKRVYATDDPDQAIVYFKDEAMAFHGLKRGRILGKGEVNNAISEQFFKMLEENGASRRTTCDGWTRGRALSSDVRFCRYP